MTTLLIIPGLHSSGPAHWQTWMEEQLPATVRVIQSDWSKADLPAWSARVRRDIARNPGRLIIAAHSFGALAAVHAGVAGAGRIAGALLVAPADPDKFNVAEALPRDPLPFPAVVVASSNDPWMSLWKAADWADRWGADLVNLGDAGHINAEAGFSALGPKASASSSVCADARSISQVKGRSGRVCRTSPHPGSKTRPDQGGLGSAVPHRRRTGWGQVSRARVRRMDKPSAAMKPFLVRGTAVSCLRSRRSRRLLHKLITTSSFAWEFSLPTVSV